MAKNSHSVNRNTIRLVMILGWISIIGILATQVIWVHKAFTNQDREFNDRVHISLTKVTEDILAMKEDAAYIYNPVTQISNNSFVVQMNDTLHPYLLESLLAQEFGRNNLSTDFEYGIYDCFTDSIVYGGKVSMNNSVDTISKDITGIKWDRDGHYFGVYFPNKSSDIISAMKQWIFTSIILFFVVFFFAYSMFVILRQRRLSEVKTDFINNMTHELKTPISTIALSSEVLLSEHFEKEPERLKQYAEIIKNENERLRRQVDKVLQIATLDKGEIEMKHEALDMHELLKRALVTLKILAQQKGGKLSADYSAINPIVRGDRVHLTNVIYNLIDNAIKYSSKPIIELRTHNEDQLFYLSVKDNGKGLSKEDSVRIFEKFYRVPQGNIHDVKGFGLGLYYVKRIMESHKGKITVDSKLGESSTFTIGLLNDR